MWCCVANKIILFENIMFPSIYILANPCTNFAETYPVNVTDNEVRCPTSSPNENFTLSGYNIINPRIIVVCMR